MEIRPLKPLPGKFISPGVTLKPVTALRSEAKPVATGTQAAPSLVLQLRPEAVQRIRPVVSSTQAPGGPDPERYLSLVNQLESKDSVLIEDINIAAGWDPALIFQDKSASHIFYYLPRELVLKQSANELGLSLQYNSSATQGSATVILTAELTAPFRSGDAQFLRQILIQALKLPTTTNVVIRDIPTQEMQLDIPTLAAGLSIPAERISVQIPSHLRETMRLTMHLTPVEAEAIMTQIANEGVSGTLQIPVAQTTLNIPWRIRYRETSATLSSDFRNWWLQGDAVSALTNETLFPVELKGIVAWRLANGQLERLYRPFTKPVTLKPGEKRPFTIPPAASIFGEKPIIAWLDAVSDWQCKACIDSIRTRIERGVSDIPQIKIGLEAIPSLFEQDDIYRLLVKVQSPWFTADRDKIQEQVITLSAEQLQQELTLFFPEGRGADPLLFKYQLKVIYASGKTLESQKWISSHERELFIGRHQLNQISAEASQ